MVKAEGAPPRQLAPVRSSQPTANAARTKTAIHSGIGHDVMLRDSGFL